MMHFIRTLLVVLPLVMAGCTQSENPRETARTPSAAPVEAAATAPAAEPDRAALPRIVFLGDSLMAGHGLAREDAVPSLIQDRLDAEGYAYEVVNAGVSGDTSAAGLGRLDWVLEGDVAILVLELGANDGLRGLPVASMKRNLEEIITRSHERGITVLLTGMEALPNYGAAYTNEFRQAFRDLARDHDVAFLPFFLDGVAGIPHLNQGDGIHPNADGTRIVAETVWRELTPLLDGQGE